MGHFTRNSLLNACLASLYPWSVQDVGNPLSLGDWMSSLNMRVQTKTYTLIWIKPLIWLSWKCALET